MTAIQNKGKRIGWPLIGLTVGWVLIFSYLLLTSDPPNIGPVRLRSLEDPGHLLGSLLLGLLVFLVFSRWSRRSGRVALLSLVVSVTFLIGLELFQELRPGRGYERIDGELNLVGATVGVALGWASQRVRARFRLRDDKSSATAENHS